MSLEKSLTVNHKPFCIIISSPSGAGKTTICNYIKNKHQSNTALSVSVTTRNRRPSEVDGTHYIFNTEQDFKRKISENFFLEYANVFGNYYGTPKDFVLSNLKNGLDVLFDIDWQGARQIRSCDLDVVSVFILPPSMDALRERLTKRAGDAVDVVQKRMEMAASEIEHYSEYDYIIINEDLQKSVSQIDSIIEAERKRREKEIFVQNFVKNLVKNN